MKKKLFIFAICGLLIAVFAFRIYRIVQENDKQVFNPARAALTMGTPVDTIVIKTETGALKEPLFVKNGKAFVSASRVNKFKIGQKLGKGYVTSVSRTIDLETGLYAIKTSSPDGQVFVEMEYKGVFVPVAAVSSGQESQNYVFVAKDGLATIRNVRVIATDSKTAVIAGIEDGTEIILSKVSEGEKVNIK